MEFDCNNVDENEKYAFLLGSAIKNEDSDQFFSIYDSIIPKDLPDSQVTQIKARVQEILDLPEEEFNDLVSKARTFSLASAGTNRMSCRELSDHTLSNKRGTFYDESEDEGLGSATLSQARGTKSETSSLYSTTKCSTWSSESETLKCDELNLCNSSKTSNSINSLSDQDGSDCESKGYYGNEYYPAKIRYPPQVKIRSGLGINLDYDEAYEVRSEHSSHGDVNSPRSDTSEGVEMVTMGPGSRPFVVDVEDDLACSRRGTSMDQDDFNTSEESDGEDEQRRNYYNQGYRPLLRESKTLTTSKYGSTKYYSDRASSSLHYPEVDHPIVFSSLKDGTSKYSRHSTYDSMGSSSGLTAGTKDVKFEKNSYKKDRPPFGSKEQFNRVANSIDSLITSVPDDEVRNMPEARRLELLTPEENKKKKKKKKKDDVGTDQNGNPLVSSQDLKSGYRQMRESPSIGEGSAGNYQNISNYGAVQYSPYTTNEQSSFHKGSDTATRLQERRGKNRRKREEELQKSQDVKNYVGDKLEIEDLVNFIDGQNVSLKKSKKQSPSIADDIPNKTQKPNKKSKDKKQKSPSIEESEAVQGDNSAQPATLDQQAGVNNMGNLSGKTEVNASIENSETESSNAKKDKIPNKPLLKDDKKLVVSETIVSNHHMPQASNKAVYCKESVKDKEVPKTNNKRVAAATEPAVDELKPKKGGDKSVKASKSEKVDMSKVSKAEHALTIDTSGNVNGMSVKQKNSKNKKSKPSSPSAKLENNVQVGEVFDDQSLISQILDRDLYEDKDFIFTDLYVPEVPKEDEFQVVGKKKKKPVKEIIQPYQQNNYVNNGNKYRKPYEDKGRSNSYVNNKFIPPVTNNYHLPTEQNNVRARDLSPSAFPALGSGKGRQSLNDGRRNSTGDVQIPLDLKSQDDGDRESVKSLPATKPSDNNTTEIVTSPRVNMSYAKMAAGVANNIVVQPSSIGAGNVSSDPKITVWKGNARERRHSIGSSPEDVGVAAVHAPSSPTAVPLKAGSEENLKDVVPNTSVVSGTSKVKDDSNGGLDNGGDSYRKVGLEGSVVVASDTVKNEERRNSVKEAAVSASSTVSVHSQPLASSRTESVGKHNSVTSVAATDSSDQSKTYKPSLSKGKGAESESKINSISQSTEKQSALNVHTRSEMQKSKVNGTNNRKHKSVIFYDKRLEDTNSSLDISFGFELGAVVNAVDSFETSIPSSSSLVNASDNSEITFNNSDLSANHLVQAVSCASITFDSNSSLDQPSIINVIETPSSDSNTDNSSGIGNIDKQADADINEQSDKVSKLVHLNGVVSPPQGQHIKVVKQSLEDETPVEQETGIKPASSEPTVTKTETSCQYGSGIERIYYGENVATLKKDVLGPSSTNGPTSYCGYIQFLINVETKNNFYLAEAATFLTREWDRTINLQDKDPNSVKFHHE